MPTGAPNRRQLLAGLAAALMPLPLRAQAQAEAAANPIVARDGQLVLDLDRLEPLDPGGWLLARTEVPPSGRALLGPGRTDPGYHLLARLHFEGRAAGNHGDLYDNLDRGHSGFGASAFPQLTRVVYGTTARAAGLDYGLADRILFDAPVIGNSSTALTSGPLWRSQPRFGLTAVTDGPARLARIYMSGALRVYPEHRDHDPEHGDTLPANTPYYLLSQGSSGSDRKHLEALAMILAGFRSDTKAALKRAGLIAPTLQMVYRRGRRGMDTAAAYLSGPAHPTAFPAEGIDLAAMVARANALTPDEIPPLVRLAVESETQAHEGLDFFGEGLSETLFDTPAAIARVWRSAAGRREMVVSVAGTRDPGGRPLRFHWVLLQGDPARSRIEPLDAGGHRARIRLDWQSARPAPGRADILSPRIDIGVFADNGACLSAPSFISVLLPAHETRAYETGPGGGPRPLRIDRAARDRYVDPLVFPATEWRDDYRYNADGSPQGWDRHAGDEVTRYDADGRLVDGAVRRPMRYPVDSTAPAGSRVVPRRFDG